ncbi:diphthine--ammonia ligase [Alkalicoccus chagannorensis]
MKTFFTSWSGGKDSTLAHYTAMQQDMLPAALVTMFEEEETRSRSHALPKEVLDAQAAALNLPLYTRGASWSDYEAVFSNLLQELRSRGIHDGVFGDIDLEGHREWVEKVCTAQGIQPHQPLWQEPREDVLQRLLDAGFHAIIIVVKEDRLPASFLGRSIDPPLIKELEAHGVDPCGEEGEFHTVVVDGPIFSRSVRLQYGEVEHHDGYAFLPVTTTD